MANQHKYTISAQDEARFWAKVDRHGPNECWPWLGSRKPSGYGTVRMWETCATATHVAMILAGNRRSSGEMCALHSCDNRICVNPAHLRWGTRGDNWHDKIERNPRSHEHVRGERSGRAKLTEGDVKLIRSSSLPLSRLATLLGVGKSTIRAARTGKSWAHL